jgi:hypothetical protein
MDTNQGGTAIKPNASLSISHTVEDDHKFHAAGCLFVGVAFDRNSEIHIWQSRAVHVDEQGLADILNGLFDFPFAPKAGDFARQIVANSHCKSKTAGATEAVSCQSEHLVATQQHFEAIHLNGNVHASEKDEHGVYLLKSVQDAWAGWRSCAGV